MGSKCKQTGKHRKKARGNAGKRVGKREFCRWVGRGVGQVNEQAARYRMPIGEQVDLPAWCRWVFDFLAAHAQLLARARGADADESRAEAERRKTVAQANREELRLARERAELVDAAEAEARRLELVRWMVGVFERAPTELYTELAAVERSQIRPRVEAYFDRIRGEVAGNGEAT